jgi:hypothetical protein
MAIVDRNVLRLAVYEFLYEPTPRTVAINEALEVARRFSTYEATQFINGILDAVKRDLDQEQPQPETATSEEDDEDGDDAADSAEPGGDEDEVEGDAAADEDADKGQHAAAD